MPKLVGTAKRQQLQMREFDALLSGLVLSCDASWLEVAPDYRTTALLHYCTTAPLQHCNTATLQHCTHSSTVYQLVERGAQPL